MTYRKMNPEAKAKWVEALREPNLKQGRSYLKTTSGECCLGVLCRVAIENGVELEITTSTENIHGYMTTTTSFDGDNRLVPKAVMDWARIDYNPTVYDAGRSVTLSYLNDGGVKFDEIAQIIEENL